MTKLKLLIYSDLPVLPTGYARQMKDILPFLRKEFDIVYVALNSDGKEELKAQMDFQVYPRVPGSRKAFDFRDEVYHALSTQQIDLIFTDYDWRVTMEGMDGLARFPHIPWVAWSCYEGEPMIEGWRHGMQFCNCLIAQTDYHARQLRDFVGLSEFHIETVMPAVNPKIFMKADYEKFIKPEREAKNLLDKRVILSIGKNQRRKNFGALIEGVALAGDKYHLHIITFDVTNDEGFDLQGLADYYGLENFTYYDGSQGFMEDGYINYWYNIANCFVLTSQGEGVGMPLLESMATGTRVLAPDYGAMGEVVRKFKGGLLFDKDKCVFNHGPVKSGFREIYVSPQEIADKLEKVFNIFPTCSLKELEPEQVAERLIKIIYTVHERTKSRPNDYMFKTVFPPMRFSYA